MGKSKRDIDFVRDYEPEFTKDGELIITREMFKVACPEVYEEILELGKNLGRMEEAARMAIPKISVPSTEDLTKPEKKKRLIAEYQKAHPEASLKEATLAIGKSNPELFR